MSLKTGDLSGTILPEISIDEFEPKAGDNEDVIVVAFYLDDTGPADDLNTFIQRGFVDTLAAEVSPNTDEDGRYIVFVEMSRNETFPEKFNALVKDVENVAGKLEWKIKTYLSDGQTFEIGNPELFNYVTLTPDTYVTKDKFDMDNIAETINEFFSNSYISNLTMDGNTVTLSANGRTIVAEVVDAGDYDIVVGRNFLTETAFRIGQNPYEAKVLENMLGNCSILPLGKYLCVNRDDKVVLLANTTLKYRN